jgi:very-short-patch-repair endonuclease
MENSPNVQARRALSMPSLLRVPLRGEGAQRADEVPFFFPTSDGICFLIRPIHMKTPPLIYARAKAMRREPTAAERKLWGGLRKRSLGNFKFVRQQPVGLYIVDFLCRKEKLIVEVDGETHGDARDVAYDQRRTVFLEREGYKVLRVDNHAVFTDIGNVLDYIFGVLSAQ